ncbi:hypothetical protein DICSQDRAFT_94010 [Dichomitus squalens LYAD-421 SS1]|uniref:F-box domain-containing protein n=1 Tax=Dichomitus squalens (strain LYAD-421) TaxID=732165 RepID=R7SK41_DICSQ|nr:uncharacterized protein DICSQDRAFT_94010 [Dichomitus squalens LYAD-421 SS1]EJF56105.1 hypothetical protein DICSQDRAFT_94010 [Dichomitus squalens LYAD-421 SS1]
MQFVSLPPELLATILLDLGFRDLLRCRQVCSLFKSVIDGDVRAHYKVELAAAGMQDGPPSALTPAERLSILRRRQDAWTKLAWTAKEEVPMRRGGVWELYGNVLAQAEGERTLHFKQLPSAIRGIKGKEWTIQDVGCKIRDFGMDSAQDLLIVLEHCSEPDGSEVTCRVHLRSLSTGAPHPAASKTGILTPCLPEGRCTYTIQTSEDNLGLLISGLDELIYKLVIFNWKTGALRLCTAGPDLPSFAFLSTRHILIAILPELELTEDNNIRGPNDPYLIVVDVDANPVPYPPAPCESSPAPTCSTDLKYVCAFRYPRLGDTFIVTDISIRSDPAPNWQPSPSLGVPFSVSREDRLLVITLQLYEGPTRFGIFSLVLTSTFLSRVARVEREGAETGGGDVGWTEWGPQGSRLLLAPETHTRVWVCYVYGTTFGLLRWRGSRKVVLTLDFNQLAIRRARLKGGGCFGLGDSAEAAADGAWDAGGVKMTEMTAFRPGRVFKEEVATGLGYWLRMLPSLPFGDEESSDGTLDEERQFEAVMLAEDAFVVVSDDEDVRKYRILTF